MKAKLYNIVLMCVFLAVCSAKAGTVCNKADGFYKVVAADGSGDYTTIQSAINDCKSFPYQRITIFVKNGVYHEKVKVYEWNPDITLKGESRDKTIIEYGDYFGGVNLGVNSTFHTSTLLVEGDGFIASNLTIKNTAGEVGQAIALSVHADNVIITNCRILGNQDTLYVTGNGFRNYFQDCYIEGTTDFIFGGATAYFNNCTIHSLKDSYITAASTPQGNKYGFVFNNCKLTADTTVKEVYLGRPWRRYAKTFFLNCEMGSHIKPEGWHNWNKPDAEKNAFYAEYNNSDAGYKPKERVKWSHQLSASQVENYTMQNCLGKEMAERIKQLNLITE